MGLESNSSGYDEDEQSLKKNNQKELMDKKMTMIVDDDEEEEVVEEVEDEEELTEQLPPYYLSKFTLYETRSNFYMVGSDKTRKFWRVLKIDRSEPSDLVISEDPTVYTYQEKKALLGRIDVGNKTTGGLKIITTCYGIVGFIKFLGPYYMLLITERKKVGKICGHAIYAVSKSKMIPIPHSSMPSIMDNSKNENRYKKLLCNVDITKDFFFSYSYRIMHTLQKNLCEDQTKLVPYETMFVWNAFLTRGIRSRLGNTLWTVALVHGFFKQAKFSESGRTFNVTLIARRSRHFAGTRYLKRGINEKGRAANDVETEQIVFKDVPDGCVSEISSIVQIRGSIPLFWSQETSRLNLKPGIQLSKEDLNYQATRRHFQDLVDRYGNPIYILNLIKKKEKKPRESILHVEFVNAVASITRGFEKDNRLKLLNFDLTGLYRTKGAKVLKHLDDVSRAVLGPTGFFCCQVSPFTNSVASSSLSQVAPEFEDANNVREHSSPKAPRFQNGVLRTNCIDCLDRTNVAQYAFGLVALGHQLHAIGINPSPKIDLNDPLAYKLMGLYEDMGDTLAFQYGGSAAHNKIFSERRGHWKAATQSQEFIRSVQRYWNNAYMDPEKQDAINLFLGHFQPEVGKPALWELDSDQHFNIGRHTPSLSGEISRSFLKRSLSDGVIIYENSSPTTPADCSNGHRTLPDVKGDKSGMSDSTPEITTCETISCSRAGQISRVSPSVSTRQLFTDRPEAEYLRGECSRFNELGDGFDSDIVDLDWISSSGNSCEEEPYDRSSLLNTPAGSFYVNHGNEAIQGRARSASPVPAEFPESFANWVEYGAILA